MFRPGSYNTSWPFSFGAKMQDFINKISTKLISDDDYLIHSLFLDKSKFIANPKQAEPIQAKVIGNHCVFSYNPEIMDSLPDSDKAYLLFSEMYGILFKHPIRENSIIDPDEKKKGKYNEVSKMASRLSVHDYVCEHFENFIGDPDNLSIPIPSIESLDLDHGDSYEHIFETLREIQDEQEGSNDDSGEGDGEGDEDSDSQKGKGGARSQGEDPEGDSEGDGDSEGSGEQNQGNSKREIENFLNDLSNDFEDEGGDEEKLPEEFKQQRPSRSDNSQAPVFGKKVEAHPTYSKAWNRIVRWSIKKKKENDMEFHNQWAFPNQRVQMISKELVLPADKMILESDKAFSFWLFLDISGSCVHLGQKFFEIAKSIPRTFDVKGFLFDTETHPFDPFKNSKIVAGGGTSFRCIEQRIQHEMKTKKISYPDFVVVITDGEGGFLKCQHPERWSFFLEARESTYYYSRGGMTKVKNSNGTEKYLYLPNEGSLEHSSFFNNPKRNKFFPPVLSLDEFDHTVNKGKFTYEYAK